MKEVNVADVQPSDPEGLQIGLLHELTETERLESAVEHLSQIEQLRPEAWSKLTESEREWGLRRVGRSLLDIYECPAPPFIGSRLPEVDGGKLLGAYSDSEYITRLDRELLKMDDAGMALETYLHEYRHAYQHEEASRYTSAFRHLCHDEATAAQWAQNLNGHYISFEEDPEGYEVQAVEKDARDFADRLRNEVRRRQSK